MRLYTQFFLFIWTLSPLFKKNTDILRCAEVSEFHGKIFSYHYNSVTWYSLQRKKEKNIFLIFSQQIITKRRISCLLSKNCTYVQKRALETVYILKYAISYHHHILILYIGFTDNFRNKNQIWIHLVNELGMTHGGLFEIIILNLF